MQDTPRNVATLNLTTRQKLQVLLNSLLPDLELAGPPVSCTLPRS